MSELLVWNGLVARLRHRADADINAGQLAHGGVQSPEVGVEPQQAGEARDRPDELADERLGSDLFGTGLTVGPRGS